ncbi:uncharacterized protein TNCV_2349941 [Trichonephila clavipes]|uniref:Uncharacterized protein n=1 Tax=Trichonephila clavipes TaxID=2585209 RepID=A0A8X6SMB9_TRICX|nr:uncharacterized protein TNCV_2349941 [Trichonephila clavipes]
MCIGYRISMAMDWVGWSGKLADTLARSLLLDFFFWGHMKSLVYASPVNSNEALITRIAVVAGEIREMPVVFANFRHSLRRRCETCNFADGRFFEQFL